MKKMKIGGVLLLVFLSLAACGKKKQQTETPTQTTNETSMDQNSETKMQTLTLSYEDSEKAPLFNGVGTDVPTNQPGVYIEVLRLMGERLGIKVQFKRFPWKRCLMSMKDDIVNGAFDASFKPERLEYGEYPTKDGKVDPSKRLLRHTYVFYKRKGDKVDWNGRSFVGLTGPIGAPSGWSVVDDLRKRGVEVEEAITSEVNFKKLEKGRIQLVATQELQGDQILKKYKDIEKIKTPFKSKDYYLMLSHQFVKKNPELAKKIWAEIETIRNTKFQEIYDKYAANE